MLKKEIQIMLFKLYKLDNLNICYDLFRLDMISIDNAKFPMFDELSDSQVEMVIGFLKALIKNESLILLEVRPNRFNLLYEGSDSIEIIE